MLLTRDRFTNTIIAVRAYCGENVNMYIFTLYLLNLGEQKIIKNFQSSNTVRKSIGRYLIIADMS